MAQEFASCMPAKNSTYQKLQKPRVYVRGRTFIPKHWMY